MSLPDVTLLYKVYIRDLPMPSGRALELFIGDHQVRKYSEFSGGLFFTVNDPELAERFAGGAIRLRFEGADEAIASGVTVLAVEAMRDMLKESARQWPSLVLPARTFEPDVS